MPKRGRPPELTELKSRFVDAYIATGANGTAAAALAGYQGEKSTLASRASKLLRDPLVLEAIAERSKGVDIASPEERQRFWTRVMRGHPFPQWDKKRGVLFVAPMPPEMQMRASETLGKVQRDFAPPEGEDVPKATIVLPDNGRGDVDD